jgi:hypothetical protein
MDQSSLKKYFVYFIIDQGGKSFFIQNFNFSSMDFSVDFQFNGRNICGRALRLELCITKAVHENSCILAEQGEGVECCVSLKKLCNKKWENETVPVDNDRKMRYQI